MFSLQSWQNIADICHKTILTLQSICVNHLTLMDIWQAKFDDLWKARRVMTLMKIIAYFSTNLLDIFEMRRYISNRYINILIGDITQNVILLSVLWKNTSVCRLVTTKFLNTKKLFVACKVNVNIGALLSGVL